MNFTIIECEQRSPEWRQARLGKLTGSAAADMMTKIKTGESAARRKLRVRLALERLTGRSQESDFVSASMQHGIDTEPMAVAEYEARTGTILEPVGFCDVPDLMTGCSLDSFVCGNEGIVEIKCPDSSTHYEYLKAKKIPTDYYWQCLHNAWVTGVSFCDFVSFDPRFEERLQFLCIRFEPTSQELRAYDEAARQFLSEVSAEIKEMQELAA